MLEPVQPVIDFFAANIHWMLIAVVMHLVVLGTVAYLILFERKVAAWAQDRIGPNRTGFGFGIIPFLKDIKFWGLGQSFADGIKMLTKEDYRSPNTDKVLFTLAPIAMMVVVVVSIAVIPWGGAVGDARRADITTTLQQQIAQGQSPDILAAVEANIPRSRKLLSDVTARVVDLSTGDHSGPVVATITPSGFARPLPGDAVKIDLANLAPNQRILVSYTDGWRFQIANLNIGVLFIVAVLSLAVYGVVIGGYASNNKYSFLGGIRATANMISYEIPLGLSILTIVILFGTLDMGRIVEAQAHLWGVTIAGFEVGLPAWNVFAHPLAFVLFLICIHAEANRAPFDIAEAEQELVGGYHTEYTSMRFGLFFLAEYAGMITTSAICVALFFGGWHMPGLHTVSSWVTGATLADPANPSVTSSVIEAILRAGVFFTKTLAILFIFLWVRWSLPRFRFDQIMALAWRMLIPISLALLVATAAGVFVLGGSTLDGLSAGEALVFLVINLVVAGATLVVGSFMPSGMESTNRKIDVPNSRFAIRTR